jgi:uncharacterized phage protein gp47/JayE
MSTYGSTGLSMDRYADILAQMIALAEAWKGSSLSTDEQTLMGHLLRQVAYQTDNVNEKIQSLYSTMSVSDNIGNGLDNIVELIGLSRQSAVKSTATVTCIASKACTIPAGSLVKTSANVYFSTDEDLIFAGSGYDYVGVTCTEFGPISGGAGEINTIVNSVNGWSSVNNVDAIIPGRNRETDVDLKIRHTTAVATSGERDAASIAEAVGAVAGVSAVKVLEDTASSIPVYVYVIGGTDADIAKAIDDQLTVGIGTGGTTAVDVYNDTLREVKTIRFSRATDVDIYIDMVLSINENLFPADGALQIKEALSGIFNGNSIGVDVIYNQLFQPIYTVPGVIVSQLFIGTSPSPSGTSNITIGNAWRAVLDTANIGISYV